MGDTPPTPTLKTTIHATGSRDTTKTDKAEIKNKKFDFYNYESMAMALCNMGLEVECYNLRFISLTASFTWVYLPW